MKKELAGVGEISNPRLIGIEIVLTPIRFSDRWFSNLNFAKFDDITFDLRSQLSDTVNYLLELLSYKPIKRVKMLTY